MRSRARAIAARLRGPAGQAAVIAIAVAVQESAMGANPVSARPNADGDAGPVQQRQRPRWYGSLAQVTKLGYAADTFLAGDGDVVRHGVGDVSATASGNADRCTLSAASVMSI